MRLLYLNPNSTTAMTDSMVAVASRALPGVEVLGWTNHEAPPAIQGPEDGRAAVPGLLARLPEAAEEGVDAIVIGCFDDTGLAEIRATAHCPVIGIGQTACTAATLLGLPYTVVTTLQVSVPVIRDNIVGAGLDILCRSVRASDLPVLTVEAGGDAVCARLLEVMAEAEVAEGVRTAVLGCAGMSALRPELQRRTSLTLIDGVEASAHLGVALARLSRH